MAKRSVTAVKSRYRGPVEIYGASEDEIIPMEHAESLANKVPGARYQALEGDHNGWSYAPGLHFSP